MGVQSLKQASLPHPPPDAIVAVMEKRDGCALSLAIREYHVQAKRNLLGMKNA
jgi:hypothetical protein